MSFSSFLDNLSNRNPNFFTDEDKDSHSPYLKIYNDAQEIEYQSQQPYNQHRYTHFSMNRSIDQVEEKQQQKKQPQSDNNQIGHMIKEEYIQKQQIVASEEMREKRKIIKKGFVHQTDHLGLYFKQLTLKYLEMMRLSRLLTNQETDMTRRFKEKGGSIDEFNLLFKSQKIKKYVRSWFESKYIVEDILKSKMLLRNKLVALKYLPSLRLIACKPLKMWKIKFSE